MEVLLYIALFFLACTAVGICYCCIAVGNNKNKEFYDERWFGSLTVIENYNCANRCEIFQCENHYEHAQAKMKLIVNYTRPPLPHEKTFDGMERCFDKAKVIELEGRYFWEDLSQRV